MKHRIVSSKVTSTVVRKKTSNLSVPGILVGCYALESLQQSDFRYFYEQKNVDSLCRAVGLARGCEQRALDPTNTEDFSQDEPIGRILERMMINRWTQNVSYENYFDRCQPTECRYSFTEKVDVLFIITSVTALIGGLTNALQFLIPLFVRFTRLHNCF